MKTVLFFGAGASKPLGIPTTVDFVEEFAEEIKRKKFPDEQIKFYTTIQKNLNKNHKPNNDIEAVLSILDNFAQKITFKGLGPTATFYHIRYFAKLIKEKFGEILPTKVLKNQKSKDIEMALRLRDKLKTYIWKRCRKVDISKILSVYDPFFNAVAEGGADYFTPSKGRKIPSGDIFTTNYDLCLETFFERLKVKYNKGIGYNNITRMATLKFENYNKGGQVRLFKIHGSVDLYKMKSGAIGEFLISPSSKRTPSGDKIKGEWMIYPIQAKYMYNEPFFSIFNEMKKAVQNAEYTIIVGSSLRDDAIKAVFTDHIKKGILIDPKADDILKQNAPGLQAKIVPVNKKFDDFETLKEVTEILKKKDSPDE